MTDAQKRIVFCNDRYLEIYGLTRSDIPQDMTGRELLEMRRKRGVARRQRRGVLRARRQARTASSPNCPTGGRFWSSISRCRTAARSRRMRIAASSASFRGSSPRPSSSWNRCSTTCRSAWPPRASRTAATSSPTARSNASRASPATHIVGKRADEIFQAATAASIEAADQAALDSPDGQFRNEFDGRARLGEARSRLQPRGRARRQEPAGIPDRAVRRRHRPPIAVRRSSRAPRSSSSWWSTTFRCR